MALIAIACYSTEENKKDDCLFKTLVSLKKTVDFNKHTLMLSVNSLTDTTRTIIDSFNDIISQVIFNETNIGTAEAINKVWQHRLPDQHCVKMDDDVVIYNEGWLDLLEEAISRDNNIGILGAKRKDCCENPAHQDPQYRSTYFEIPHTPGEKWIVAEQVKHVMGTCQMYNYKLLEKIGYLYQLEKYGFDDVLASYRSEIAGFKNAFLPQIEIDHIDDGATEYQGWKERLAGEQFPRIHQLVNDYISGKTSIYYNPF
jgi:GT2 family glycosyltransferase